MPITEGNWDLHQGGSKDASRHREKLKDAFKNKLHDIISQEDIITSEKGKKVKVPIRALDSYRFVFDPKKRTHTGQGEGDTEVGDVLKKEGEEAKEGKAGEGAGAEYYEAEIDIADLVEMMLEDLRLPRLDPKKMAEMTATDVRYDEVRKKGTMSNLDKKRSLIENIKKNARQGDPTIHDLDDDDLRFRTWTEYHRPVTSAVVLAMMDVSASMGTEKKYLARSFFFWMVNFLRAKYNEVSVEFISHTIDAHTCTEHEFFYKGESGGTRCSSAYELSLDLIKTKYDPNMYNIFAFHFSDGDTFGDEDECIGLVNQLADICNMVGYGEINTNGDNQGLFGFSHSTLSQSYKNIDRDNFVMNIINSKSDVWPTLRKFFSEELSESS